MDKVTLIEKARDMILDEDNWVQGCNATDAQDKEVPPSSPNAVKWCALGALYKVSYEYKDSYDIYGDVSDIIAEVAEEISDGKYMSAVDINDNMGHSDVMLVYDKVIEIMAKEEV